MKKLLSFILALAMVLAVIAIAGCTTDPNNETTTTASSQTEMTPGSTETETTAGTTTQGDATETTTPTETTTSGSSETTTFDPELANPYEKLPGYLDVDFGGKTFMFATDESEVDGRWISTKEIYATEEESSRIMSAVYERNLVMKNLYNCNIAHEVGGGSLIKNDVDTGTYKFDMIGVRGGPNSYASSYYHNVYSFSCDFSQPWWDQAYFSDFTVKDNNGVNKLFGLSGYFNYTAMAATWTLFFNKDIYEQTEGVADIDIYQLVREGQWTMDKLLEMIKLGRKDANGDQKLSHDGSGDVYGMFNYTHTVRGFYYAAGCSYVGMDANGKPICTMADNNAVQVVDKIIEIWSDPGTGSGQTVGYSDIQEHMPQGQALFASETMDMIERIAQNSGDLDYRLGVVPLPKFSAEQENYYAYVNTQGDGYGVSAQIPSLTVMSNFLELFAYHSYKIVLPAYIEAYAIDYCGDDASKETIKLIVNSRKYDWGYYLNAGQVDSLVSQMVQTSKNTLAQAAKKNASAVVSKVQDYIDTVTKLEG